MDPSDEKNSKPIRFDPSEKDLGANSEKELKRLQLVIGIILVLLVLGFAALFIALLVDQRTYREPQPERSPITTTNIAALRRIT